MSDSDDDKPLGQRTAVPAPPPALAPAKPSTGGPDVPSVNQPVQDPAKPVLQPKPARPAISEDSEDDLPLAKRQSVQGEWDSAVWWTDHQDIKVCAVC